MADKVIQVNVTSTKSQRVSVSPGNVQNEISATPDSSQYYSNLAKNWAIASGLILNEDYSSKHYAKESANSASSAKNYADASQVTYTNVQNAANEALTDIETARVDSVDNITTVKSESIANIEAKSNEVVSAVNAGIAEINTTKTNAVNAVTTTKNNAVTEINKEVTDGKKELNDIIEAGGSNINDKITNCLLEVPQNIKLELNNGTLTLKAGSKVTVPNGVGVFNELTISNDLTLGKIGTATLPSKLYVKADGSALVQWVNEASGATVPASGTTFGFYNTADNTCKLYNADGIVQHTVSFPIANVHRTSGSWDKIEQVFNGFGYIGSTVWVDKGVKGLVPNGRNADGTLRNIEARTESVLTYTNTSSAGGSRLYSFKTPTNGVWTSIDYKSSNSLNTGTPTSNWYYSETENKWLYQGNELSWFDFAYSTCETSSPYTITSFQPKQPFRAVDYNEFTKSITALSKAYITETYISGTSWYRVWSDGWCEQGGGLHATADATTGVKTIAFLKPFVNANYTFTCHIGQNNSDNISYYRMPYDKTATGFTYNKLTNLVGGWYACGYIS